MKVNPAKTSPLSLRSRFLIAVGRWALKPLMHLWLWSLKFEVRGREVLDAALRSGRPVILIAWHGDIFTGWLWRLTLPLTRLAAMVSRSRDGEITARLAEPFGGVCVRASSSRGGARGILELQRYLTQPSTNGQPKVAVHILDGPRGPRRQSKPGVVLLARQTGAQIIPVVFGHTRCWTLRSWDRHRIPKPFSRTIAVIGTSFCISSDAEGGGGDESRETRKIDERMAALAASDPLCAPDPPRT